MPPRSARLDQRQGQAAPGLPGEGVPVAGEGLDADVVGAGVVVFTDPAGDGGLVTPRHQGVDESVAADAGQVVVGEAEAAQVVGSADYRSTPVQSSAR